MAGADAAAVAGFAVVVAAGGAAAGAGFATGGAAFAVCVGAGATGFAAGGGGAAGFCAKVGGVLGADAGFAVACLAGAAGLTGSMLIGADDLSGGDLSSSGWVARAICARWLSGATPGGGRRRMGCGRVMLGATPGGGRRMTRPLDPLPDDAAGGAISNRRLEGPTASRAERSTETDGSLRMTDAAGLAVVVTPSARTGADASSTAAAERAADDHRLDVRRSLPRPVAAFLMRLTFGPHHTKLARASSRGQSR